MNRKKFLKNTCNLCLLGSAFAILPELSGCGTPYNIIKTTPNDNTITLALNLFTQPTVQFVRPTGWQYDIAVHKNIDGTYKAFLLQCTHADNQLVPSQNGYLCSLHGSQFSKDGKIIKGPASVELKQFKTSVTETNLIISI
jgi:Rieske Fe-S protein